MKVSKNFNMTEFLTPEDFKKVMQTKDPMKTFYSLVDPKIVELAQFYRDFFKAEIIINNWSYGGTYTLRGKRPKNTTVGASNSQHKIGRAFDCDVKGLTAEQVRQIIKQNKNLFFSKGLRRVENNVNWVHSDIKETKLINEIKFFNP